MKLNLSNDDVSSRERRAAEPQWNPALRARFHCGSAAPLLVFRGLKRHQLEQRVRGSPRAFATILDQKLRAAVAARPVSRTLHCFVRQNFKIQILIRCAGQNTRICLISCTRARRQVKRHQKVWTTTANGE